MPVAKKAPDNTFYFRMQPGPQEFALMRKDREIYYGGARGGGKTIAQIAFMLRMAVERNADGSLKYPEYRGLVIRKQADDLKGWIDEAMNFYPKFGAKAVGRPVEFHFPGGPKIYTGHLQDSNAYTKYQGHSYHKMGIDEVNQIPLESQYLDLLSSLRASPDGCPQAFLTGNPGGAGDYWIKKRFVKVPIRGGGFAPPNTSLRDPITGHHRIFIPATVNDNPILKQKDPGYVQFLHGLPEARKRAWLYGDFDAFEGQFFEEFRPSGPYSDEPDWANHVVKSGSIKLHPWLHRWMSLDWGYSHYSAAYKFCNGPDKRVHAYGELIRRRTGSYVLGVDIAKWAVDDLDGLPDHRMSLYISPDAFDTRDETHTVAERIAAGIESVLGAGSALIMKMNEEERQMAQRDPERAEQMHSRRLLQSSGKYGIAIHPANNNRVGGADYIRELLRFTPSEVGVFDAEFARSLISKPRGERLYQEYMDRFKQAEERPLPGIHIHDCCPAIIEVLPSLVHDPKRPEDVCKIDAEAGNDTHGDDPYDGFRYGVMAHRSVQNRVPKSYFIHDRLESARNEGITDMTLLSQVARGANDAWGDQNQSTGGLRFRRACQPN